VTATLECILIGVAFGFAGILPCGLAVSQLGERMAFILIGMLMLVALLVLWVLQSRNFEGDKRAGT
jgi:dipeptide/tripeptide permease